MMAWRPELIGWSPQHPIHTPMADTNPPFSWRSARRRIGQSPDLLRRGLASRCGARRTTGTPCSAVFERPLTRSHKLIEEPPAL